MLIWRIKVILLEELSIILFSSVFMSLFVLFLGFLNIYKFFLFLGISLFIFWDHINLFSKFLLGFFVLVLFLNYYGFISIGWSFTTTWKFVEFFCIFFWLSVQVCLLYLRVGKFFRHFVISGLGNIFLTIFIVWIEFISWLLQSFILSLRLVCNMFSGHVFLSLLVFMFFSLSLGSFGFCLVYLHLEFFVAILQALIICLLIMFYYSV